MDSLTDSITDLEEAFDLEVPCGGNNSPVKRPCPYSADSAGGYNPYHLRNSSYVPKMHFVSNGVDAGHC